MRDPVLQAWYARGVVDAVRARPALTFRDHPDLASWTSEEIAEAKQAYDHGFSDGAVWS